MIAIFKRELKAYFISPIGYIFIAVFLCVSGFLFSMSTLKAGEGSSVASWFMFVLIMFIVLIPLLTMRLLSEDRKSKTEQVLLTSPVTLGGVIFGKFLAAYVVFAGTFLVSCLNCLILYKYTEPNTAIIFGNMIAILLIGGAFIAIGLFISATTENQLIAAIITIFAILGLLIVGQLSNYVDNYVLRVIIDSISVMSRYNYFTYGLFDINSTIYYVSIMAIFLFLTIRIYEKRRWS